MKKLDFDMDRIGWIGLARSCLNRPYQSRSCLI